MGKAPLEGGLQRVVVGNTLAVDVAHTAKIRQLRIERTRCRGRIGNRIEWTRLVDVIHRLGQMLADVADVADGEDVGAELLLDLQIELLNERRAELGSLSYEAQAGDPAQCCQVWRRWS